MQKSSAGKFHLNPSSRFTSFDHLVGAGEQRERDVPLRAERVARANSVFTPHDPLHQPRLLAPEAHVHLAIHRRRGGQTLPSLLWLAGAAIERAQAQMAVGDKRAHAVRLGERQRLLVVSYAAFSIELVGVGSQVTEKMQRMGPKTGVALRGCDRAIAQVPGLIESSEQQTSATDCNVSPATMTNDSTRCLFFQEPLGFLDPVQRPLHVADLRQ